MTSLTIVLYQYSKKNDIFIGTTVTGRKYEELKDIVGFFTNILPIRLDFSNKLTIKQLLEKTHKVALCSFEHQELVFERIIEESNKKRNNNHRSLIPIIICLNNFPK